jgi:hypothetical protein
MDSVKIDYVMVCDAAQAVGGKLYVLGGGWDRLMMPAFPGHPPVPFAVVFGINVPWNLTNRPFTFAIQILDSDDGLVQEIATGEFEVGRPPGTRPGVSQRVPFACPANPEFPEPGRYVVRVLLKGERAGETSFEVAPLQ